jgi:hypothetical protein
MKNRFLKTIFIVAPHGFSVRYLLRTDILKVLKQPDIRIVILSPNSDEEYFTSEFRDENIVFEKLDTVKGDQYYINSRLQRLLRQIRVFVLNGSGNITTIDDLYQIYRIERPSAGILRKAINHCFDLSVILLRHSRFLRRLLLRVEGRFFVGHFHQHLFEHYRPNLVITSSLGYFRHDDLIMREAKHHGVPVVSVILSWDNTTSWGMAGAEADHVIAQSDIMKRELIELHDIQPNRIHVEGVANFDHYFHKKSYKDRNTFFSEIGLDPECRLIVLATQSPNIFPWNPELICMIAQAIVDGRLPKDCQLVARLHPLHLRYDEGKSIYQDLLDEYDRISDLYPFVIFNHPNVLTKNLDAEMPPSEMIYVTNLLKHADVMINHFSTIAIESCIFNLPTINVGFEPGDIRKKTRLKHSSKLAERRNHNQRIINTGGVRTAYNEEQLIDFTNQYLAHPEMDADARRRVVEQECGPEPGKSSVRTGSRILSILETYM